MSRIAIKLSDRARNSPVIMAIVWLSFVAAVVISVRLLVDDVRSSIIGYETWPTAKPSEDIAIWVGLVPLVAQIAFGWVAVEQQHRGYAIIAACGFAADILTDMNYRWIDGVTLADTVINLFAAIGEAIILYTVFAEVAFVFGLHNAVTYWPDFVRSVQRIIGTLADGVIFIWKGDTHDDFMRDSNPDIERRRRH